MKYTVCRFPLRSDWKIWKNVKAFSIQGMLNTLKSLEKYENCREKLFIFSNILMNSVLLAKVDQVIS